MNFSVDVDQSGDCTILAVTGDVDLKTSSTLGDLALQALADEPSVLVIDLRGVSFLDSTALSVLVFLRRQTRDREIALRLVTARKADAILKIAGLDQVFEVYSDVLSALGEADHTA